jgi:hypothetical protein
VYAIKLMELPSCRRSFVSLSAPPLCISSNQRILAFYAIHIVMAALLIALIALRASMITSSLKTILASMYVEQANIYIMIPTRISGVAHVIRINALNALMIALLAIHATPINHYISTHVMILAQQERINKELTARCAMINAKPALISTPAHPVWEI